LVMHADGTYAALDPEQPVPAGATTLGFVEQAPLPLLDALVHGIHRGTGGQVLVAGVEDPIAHEVDRIEVLGYVDSYPMNPRHRPHAELAFRSIGLTRAVDLRARRHVYGLGELPAGGELEGELGALAPQPYGDGIAVWRTAAGTLVTDRYAPPPPHPGAPLAARWVAAPLTWSGGPPLAARARSTGRRLLELPRAAIRARGPAEAEHGEAPLGYLSPSPAAHRLPLYSAVHPVTGDQLLTPWRLEATDMGYADVRLLGYMLDVAPLTGDRTLRTVTVPWASRFGHNARRE
jgi:hypothetical protein